MIVAKLPANEPFRIQALNSLAILDTPAEDVFDNLTLMIAKHLNFPIVAVSLVDVNRQWFKSTVGLSVCETGRDIAFCAHAIEHNGILSVPDAKKDIRFADNPLVTNAPYIASYFGVPLRPDGDYVVGTLCVIDNVPRKLKKAEEEYLVKMALLIEHLLKLSKSINTTQLLQHQLIQEQTRTKNAITRQHIILENAKSGMLLFDQQGTIFEANQQILSWLGLTRNKVINTNIQLIYPHPLLDRQEVLEAYHGAGMQITLATPSDDNQHFMLSVTKFVLDDSIEFIACIDEI